MKPIFRVLGSSGGLAQSLVGRAQRLAKIEKVFHTLLDAEPRAHCRVANLYRDALLVHADSPAWAARMRYLAPHLVRELHRVDPTLETVRTLKVRVRPTSASPAASAEHRRRPNRVTPETAEFIASVAAATADPALKRVLSRLAARAARNAGRD